VSIKVYKSFTNFRS